jgi:CBS domain-containing protein
MHRADLRPSRRSTTVSTVPNGPIPGDGGSLDMTFDPGFAGGANAKLWTKGEVNLMTSVREVMTTHVVTVRRTTPFKEVAQLLVDNRISGVPVVDVDGTVLGVVSEADFLAKEGGPDAIRHRPLARLLGESRRSRAQLEKLHATRAADAMTSPAITIEPGRSISEAARIMNEHRINRLPVVDADRLVGIITRADLVRAYVRSDDELAEGIREDVIRRMLWLDPASFAVDVDRGVATISGHVDRRSTAKMVEEAAAAVPGIVEVEASIAWSLDDNRIGPETSDPVFPFGPR